MRVSYGSTPWTVVEDQKLDPASYGPGWKTRDANLFLQAFYHKFPEVETFLRACKQVAALAYRNDPCVGVIFADPYDGARVRWNPVARVDYFLKSNGDTLILSLPGEYVQEYPSQEPSAKQKRVFKPAQPNQNRDYPVDLKSLEKMIAPCLIHMLDAFYSSLVMEKLAERGMTTFVGIHDCWLVPEKVCINGVTQEGRKVLREAMEEAAGGWYQGLGCVYESLSGYLDGDPDFGTFIRDAHKRWRQHVESGYIPTFKSKPS